MLNKFFVLQKELYSKKNELIFLEKEFVSADDFLSAIKKAKGSSYFKVFDFINMDKFSPYYNELRNNMSILKAQVCTLEFKKEKLLKKIISILDKIAKEISVIYNRKISWELTTDVLKFITNNNNRKNEVMWFLIEIVYPSENVYLILGNNKKTKKKKDFILDRSIEMLKILKKYLKKDFKINKVIQSRCK